MSNQQKALDLIKTASKVVFLTGAGVSVASGIPDYRSLGGHYSGIESPEYLLSRSCFEQEPDKFYQFVKKLYHPEAKPTVTHLKLAEMTQKNPECSVITQNIDQLHERAGTRSLVNFHGSLYDCFCSKCGQVVPVESYLKSDYHNKCGGRVRPDIILYEEGLPEDRINQSISEISQADVLVVAGTSFKVYPFCQLLDYRKNSSRIIVINNEEVETTGSHLFVKMDVSEFFKEL